MKTERLHKKINFGSDSILVIGNGESVLKNKIGSLINKFENIVRIKNYRISSYE